MGRRASRETAMKLLYQLEIQKEDKEDQINFVLDENEFTDNDKKYIREVIAGVHENVEFIDKLVTKYAKGWKLNRISKVELSILRLSMYEISFREDIPFSVSVNEAVELAKKYSSEEAGAFINGILGKVTGIRVLASDKKVES
jgi:transcription antitermination protein NusB